jgi:hypothetical protein
MGKDARNRPACSRSVTRGYRSYQGREQVKEYGYTPGLVEILNSQLSQNMLKAYDEGRSHGIDIGVTTERERIVTLLEELSQQPSGVNLKGAISLIKGENK